jgi:ankyrin repeat protein
MNISMDLIEACKNGNLELVTSILNYDSNYYIKLYWKELVISINESLIIACSKGYTSIVVLLLDKGGNIDIDNGKPLILACAN